MPKRGCYFGIEEEAIDHVDVLFFPDNLDLLQYVHLANGLALYHIEVPRNCG